MVHRLGLLTVAIVALLATKSYGQENGPIIQDINLPVIDIKLHVETAKTLASRAIENEGRKHDRIGNRDIKVLILEGDSWFDLPFNRDISDALEDLNYSVLSNASYGDTLENMAFNGQLEQVAAHFRFLALRKRTPNAILLSMGGNDIIGPNLALFLNHRNSSLGTERLFSQNILTGTFDRFQSYVTDYIAAIAVLCRKFYDKDEIRELLNSGNDKDSHCKSIPIIIHGYDYPVPSGAGFKVLWYLTIAGPWLEPSFDTKRYNDQDATAIIHDLVNLYNNTLSNAVDRLAGAMGIINPICYLELMGTVKERWSDELHPDADAMTEIAKKFSDRINSCMPQ